MRKVIMLERISLDGFFAGPNGEIDWFIHDSEVDKAAHEGGSADTVLFGRLTYEMFENYWPNVAKDPHASKEDKAIADELNEMNKIVFSKTLKDVTWENSLLVSGDMIKEVKKLKEEKGADIMVFGSGTIVQHLADADLIDKYMFILTPVILGEGKLLFKDVKEHHLKLVKSQGFASGNVLLRYEKSK